MPTKHTNKSLWVLRIHSMINHFRTINSGCLLTWVLCNRAIHLYCNFRKHSSFYCEHWQLKSLLLQLQVVFEGHRTKGTSIFRSSVMKSLEVLTTWFGVSTQCTLISVDIPVMKFLGMPSRALFQTTSYYWRYFKVRSKFNTWGCRPLVHSVTSSILPRFICCTFHP